MNYKSDESGRRELQSIQEQEDVQVLVSRADLKGLISSLVLNVYNLQQKQERSLEWLEDISRN